MTHKRHMNLKEMLLGDITKKIMQGIDDYEYVKKTKKGKCNCRSTHKPNGECLYKEECETKAVIYKISCKCCNSFYIGKTSRSLKSRCQEHYQGLGKFFTMKKRFLTQLEEEANPPPPTPNSNHLSSSSSRMSTRSQTSGQLTTPHPHQHSTLPTNHTCIRIRSKLHTHPPLRFQYQAKLSPPSPATNTTPDPTTHPRNVSSSL